MNVFWGGIRDTPLQVMTFDPHNPLAVEIQQELLG